MKVAMIYPSRDSEKAISGYSKTLTDCTKIDSITYTAGKPWTLFKQFKKIRTYDVIHIQHEYNLLGWYGLPFFLLYFLLFLTPIQVVTTMHTVLSLKEKFRSGRIKTFLRKWLYRLQNRTIEFSDAVIVHAEFFKEILITEYGYDEPEFLHVIPQAILENKRTMIKEEAKKKYNLEGPVYLIIGSFVPDHGADIIIKNAKDIKGTILVVASPTPYNDRNKNRIISFLEENQKYVVDNGITNVRFDISDINDQDPRWWDYFSAADLVLLPYRGGIGSGIFAHSMATHTPVVSSNIQFFNEIVQYSDAVITAEKDSDYPNIISIAMKHLSDLERGTKEYYEMYNLTKLSKEYLHLYEELATEQ